MNNLTLLILAVFTLIQSVWIVSTCILSAFNELGNGFLHLSVFIIILPLFYYIVIFFNGNVYFFKGLFQKSSTVSLNLLKDSLIYPLLPIAFFICLSMVLTSIYFFPSIGDAIAFKIPRAYFYLKNGSLNPNPNVSIGLMFLSPLNAPILLMPIFYFNLSANFFLIFSFLHWLVFSFTIYQILLQFSIVRKISLLVTFLVVFTNQFVFQGSSDNDDLIYTTYFALGALFLVLAFKNYRSAYAFLSGLGFGISLAFKPHLVWFLPGFLIVLVLYLLKRKLPTFSRSFQFIIAGIVGVLITSFPLFYDNYLKRGSFFKIDSIHSNIQNVPFNLKVAEANFLSQNASLLIHPIFESFAMDIAERKSLSEVWNLRFRNFIYSTFEITEAEFRSDYAAHTEIPFIFSENYYEHTASLGFLPILATIGFFYLIQKEKRKRWIIFSIFLLLLSFDLSYSFRVKYASGIIRQWMPISILCAILIGLALAKERKVNKYGFYSLIFFFFLFVTFFNSYRGLFSNFYRNLGRILEGYPGHTYDSTMSPKLKHLIKSRSSLNVFEFYTFPIYEYILQNPNAKISFLNRVEPGKTNFLFLFGQDSLVEKDWLHLVDFIPIPVNFSDFENFRFMGEQFGGYSFANGITEFEDRIYQTEKQYLILLVDEAVIVGDSVKSGANMLYKNKKFDSNLIFYSTYSNGRLVFESQRFQLNSRFPILFPKDCDTIVFEILDARGNKIGKTNWPVHKWNNFGAENFK